MIGTIEAIQRELSTSDGFILRYPTTGEDAGVDGLEGDEGAFLACSFWMADDLAMIGRVDEARKLFERLLALLNHLGLLAEEWDPRLQRQVGNFPQAFSHVPLIDTAEADGKRGIRRLTRAGRRPAFPFSGAGPPLSSPFRGRAAAVVRDTGRCSLQGRASICFQGRGELRDQPPAAAPHKPLG